MEDRSVIFWIVAATLLHFGYGCQMENVNNWALPISGSIYDTFRGTVISRSFSNIEAITDVVKGETTIGGPYFDVSLIGSQFVVETNDQFALYEEYETAIIPSMTVHFRCAGGTTQNIVVMIEVMDTNNNDPRFIPNNVFEFVVAPPLPPGYMVTGCLNDITVRDIDLTTQRIDFTIEDNPYFEIEYDADSSTVDKEFKAILRTTTFIRSLAEPITLTITATDVDLTNDPARSATATLRIVGDTEFQFPEEPIFDQAFYLANYSETHELNLLETISLQQGFDEYVNFILEGEYRDNFELTTNGNQITIQVVTPLPSEVWREGQIFLLVRAIREFTSGDTTTVVVQLPEEETLQFERPYYGGYIIDNSLQLSQLVLSQGYENSPISAEVVGVYASYFAISVQGNLITVSMSALSNEIIDNNSFISIQVVARGERNEATAVVGLEVIKDDKVTPVFDKSIYTATYNPNTGLNAELITITQGFDETVALDLRGDHADLFQIIQNGQTITLTSSTIPPELYSLQNILISIEATKPRTVGANSAINIALPAVLLESVIVTYEPIYPLLSYKHTLTARELGFEESIYRGTIQDNELTLETIHLSTGYEEDVSFSLNGEYATYFTATNLQSQVVISLSTPLPDNIITQNNAVLLILTAIGTNAITTTTSIVLDIIKADTITPVFSSNIYYGTYSGTALEVEAINLAQGYDIGVTFRLDGAHAEYFNINANGNNIIITLVSSIPEDVIFNEKALLFNVLAEKELTVGANAAVLITFPTELTDSVVMTFTRKTYIGYLEESEIRLENVVLSTGYATDTEFLLTGDYAEHFELRRVNNIVELSSLRTLPNEVVENNDFLVLEIEARRERAVSGWTSVVIDIVNPDRIVPVFNQAYYTGVYTNDIGLIFEETISLAEGYDETVTFELNGEWSTYFLLAQQDNALEILLNSPIPTEVIENNNQLLFTIVAENGVGVTGRAVISIDLPKDLANNLFKFDQDYYRGYFEDGNINLDVMMLLDYNNDVTYELTGDFADYFQLTNQEGTLTLQLATPLMDGILEEINVLVLTISAQNRNTRTHAAIVLEVVKRTEDTIEFDQLFYTGTYSASNLLEFDTVMSVQPESQTTVTFYLIGDDAQWFGLVQNGNSVRVVLTSAIPAAVLANNQQLVFVIAAQRPGSATARATVVISLLDEHTEDSAILGFERVTYVGSIENNQLTLPAITLSEGYNQGVQFALYGELSDQFSLTSQGAIVMIALLNALPEHLIPDNGIIVLELQATAPGAIPAYATIVIQNVEDEDISSVAELIFAQTFYSGTYTAAADLSFPVPLTLTQGYDSSVVFVLEGDNAQWFGLVQNGNSVTVVLTSAIPAAVLANNQQLVFVIAAQRPGSATARATVVISLLDEHIEDSAILGFERVTYLGLIENNQLTLPAITLSEGYNQGVQFALYGGLSDQFSLTSQGAIVTIALLNALPEHLIPDNGIIVLELQATAPGAIPAYATIVIQNVEDEDISSVVELIFAQTFYSGTYTAAADLSFPVPLTLTQGYDSSVVFVLEGDNAQWFGLVQNGNSVTVVLTSAIPAAVLANNQQLVFVIAALRPGSATARATVVISLLDEHTEDSAILGFERVTYLGSIENNQLTLPAITLSEGYNQGVQFALYGELSDQFSLTSQGAIVTIALLNALPEHLIPDNGIIVLELQATAPGAIPAYATIVIQNVEDEDISSVVELIFAQTFYSGTYTAAADLSFPVPLTLTQGYDSSVVFVLEGDNAQWFGLVQNGNSVMVVLTSAIPAAVLANNQQLVFVIAAQRPGSATARATVVISLLDEHTEDYAILGFERVTYVGSIENNQLTLPAITLSEGYNQGVQFALYGELSDQFSLTSQGAIVTIALLNALPEHLIPDNGIIVLELQATAPGAIPAYATIVIQNVEDEDISSVVELIFAQTFYSGTYTAAADLSFPVPLTLTQGYDSSVVFVLEGDNAQWFGLVQNGNSVMVVLTSAIPAAVLANNQQLVFVIAALRPGSATARATVVISLLDEHTEDYAILGFERVTYVGSIENNQLTLPAITLSEGYNQGVQFALYGELSDQFSLTSQGAIVTIALLNALPEHLIPDNGIIVLELQATAPGAIPAYATIVIQNVEDEDISSVVELIFAQTFYSGTYTAAADLSFPVPLTLTQGYDSSVVFVLEGDNAQWFGLVQNGNSVTVVLTSAIPAAVLANNQQLVFVIAAQRPGSATARATVVISLLDEHTEDSAILGFERVTYVGSIENNQLTLPAITLSEGYNQGVQFALYGELSDQFSLTSQGAIVTIALLNALPEHLIPDNGIIVLELQATAPGAIPAYATIVIQNVEDEDISSVVELIFAQTFYSGTYTAAADLSFPVPLTLTQGYDSSVVFVLEGDNAQWFGLVQNGNSVTVVLTSAIPAAVLANNQQLVFVIAAQRPGSATARATVVISLLDEHTEDSAILGFERVTYVGSIENNQLTLPAITLSEGYNQGVQFALYGELSDQFSLTSQGAIVTIALLNALPEHLIPDNGIIVLELQATAPGAIPAYATIVIQNVEDEDISSVVELIFAQTFYSGTYTAAADLSFPVPLTLTQGYDSSVVFVLEGDNAQWFGLVQNGNSVMVVLTSAIPAAVLANNQQLVFVIAAQRPGSATARATVVISLLDEHTEDSAILGFERVTYVGSIENNQLTLPAITLSEGYNQGVQFALYGELSDQFSLTSQGAIVTIALLNALPEHLIPDNGIIVLELQATAPGAIPAYATIVIQNVEDEDISSVVELIFAQTFYSGTYTAAADLSFPVPLTLTQGYDSSVVFVLEGDNAQWFGLVQNGNSVTVVLTSAIPAAVLANNQQLVFVIAAQRPGSATARATVVISLLDEHTEDSAILGFERVTYVGSIENNQLTLPAITLSEGYNQGVQFALYGELSDQFSLTSQGAIVTIALLNALPEHLIPDNGIVVLELQATAPGAIPAYATIVIQNVEDEDISSVVELIFAQTFYSGTYTAAADLSFPVPLTLTQGYDSSVVFVLEGDNAQWFGLVQNGNSVTVVLTSTIPAAVLANNQQLVFVIAAQRPGSATARATVIIYVDNDSQVGLDVAFEKVLYEGVLQNGVVSHETIILTGYSGLFVEIHGEYSSLFVSEVSGMVVTVRASGSLSLPGDITRVALELRAGPAASVLLLNVIPTDTPSPTVSFSSPVYAVRVDIAQTGLAGRVQATADNGEAIAYSLELDNVHLEERLIVNNEGELHLSAPVNSGVYIFRAIATTVFSQATAAATVQLTVEAITVCGDELVIAPLIVLDVDEEEPHYDLISGSYENCHFTLTNRWPLDQTWVYVDGTGLHTTAIDREHESIAFMPVSQVQVEVNLHCDDDAARTKRSLTSDALGPYDYGSNKWILTDTILYNSRRSFVNIIVNDINDNAPIFVGKEAEPIAVGYPVPELAERVLPRSLAELQATDADIGENAALLYWSGAAELAVAPTTGFVHLRDGAALGHGAVHTVHATDRNGQGLTGSIDLIVRLLDESHIAVVTIRDAFLDDEQTILSYLSERVGYDVKVLRSVVISDGETSEENSRKRRDVVSAAGASLQLYVYGLIEREPVAVDKLTTDITNIATAAVIIASTISLQDHLEAQEICVVAGRDTGLLVATIVLSVLLFIVLVLIAVWFFLRWRRNKNYDEFSDQNSLESRRDSGNKFPKPEVFPKPRLDISELKKSERRLQEMLEAPNPVVVVEPSTSRNEAILDLPNPEPLAPIVIQSIDKLKDAADDSSEDEFGETKRPRRKSVVTFNENVEKIIHVEDPEDISTNTDYEIYKL